MIAADSVTTQEASVVVNGQDFRHIRFEGHDYFMKSARPGSVIVEVWCRSPGSAAAESLKVASRSRDFVDRLAEGCTSKQGVAPERFSFEQSENKAAKMSQGVAEKPVEKPEAKHLPADLDPHVVPDPVTPGSMFDYDQKRY